MAADALASLPRPTRTFASDNASGVHPGMLEALAKANEGHAIAYGNDPWTVQTVERFRDLFGAPVEVLLVWGGTGANVVGLATLLSASQAVVCAEGSHINVDEGGAPERFLGAKLLDLPTHDGKLRPEQVEALAWMIGDEHHVQPRVVSITQSTELGTLYAPDEVAALGDVAHRHGMALHMDGARIANAAAALAGDLRSFTTQAGVDVISFGGTKNGMMYGEAVVFLDPTLARHAAFLRKQATQLPSKARFIAAQFNALFDGDLWLDNAAHANAMAARLHELVDGATGLELDRPPVVNSLFPRLPAGVAEPLKAFCPFYDWDLATRQVRWMTTWDTSDEDVERFAAGVRAALA